MAEGCAGVDVDKIMGACETKVMKRMTCLLQMLAVSATFSRFMPSRLS